eukprot:6186102-Pleurochrysis_carterae.AAC.1
MSISTTRANSANQTSSSGGLYASFARLATPERSTSSSTRQIVGPPTHRSSCTSVMPRCGFYP